MAKQPRQTASPESPRLVKVQTAIDASQYTRMAAAAAMLGVSHSRFVSDAINASLKDLGIVVVQRRSAGQGNQTLTVEGSDTAA